MTVLELIRKFEEFAILSGVRVRSTRTPLKIAASQNNFRIDT